MNFKKSNLNIVSDFIIKEIQKDEYNIDLIIQELSL